jgi:hypothetical protein
MTAISRTRARKSFTTDAAEGHFFTDPQQDFCGSDDVEMAANPIRLTDDGMLATYDSTYLGIASVVDNNTIGLSRSGDRAFYGMPDARPKRR